MKIYMPDMHSSIPTSFGNAFRSFGATLLLQGHSFAPDKPGPSTSYWRHWSQQEIDLQLGLDNVRPVENDEILDDPPDVIVISCLQNEEETLQLWKQLGRRPKLVHYSGNDATPYDYTYVANMLSADASSMEKAGQLGINMLYYFPWIDYDTFTYAGHSDIPVIRTYILHYRRGFPESRLALMLRGYVKGVTYEYHEDIAKYHTADLMKNSLATLHIKEQEGYGYAIIESLASGRPVILYRPFTEGRSYRSWCVDGESAIYFDSPAEYIEKMNMYITNSEHRHMMQKRAAEIVRQKINNTEQNTNLKNFFESLV